MINQASNQDIEITIEDKAQVQNEILTECQKQQSKQQMACFCLSHPSRQKSNPSNIPQNIISCVCCGKRFHISCLRLNSKDQQAIFECQWCTLSKMDPINQVVQTLVEPNYLKNLVKMLRSGRYTMEIRCVRVDSKVMYETTWPDMGEMYINQVKVQDFKPLRSNSSLNKRKDEKYHLKHQNVNMIKQGRNFVLIQEFQPNQEDKQNFKIKEGAVHVFGVYLVKKLQSDELVRQITQNNLRSSERCVNSIKEQFRPKHGISIDKLSVPLTCSLYFIMINTPAKGKFCKHVQCFSLENMIIVSESQVPRKWKCPICKEKCYEMVVDEYMLKIINEVKAQQGKITEVTFDKTGGYSFLQGQYKKEVQGSQEREQNEGGSGKGEKMEIEGGQANQGKNGSKEKKIDNIMILSDGEDDGEKQELQPKKVTKKICKQEKPSSQTKNSQQQRTGGNSGSKAGEGSQNGNGKCGASSERVKENCKGVAEPADHQAMRQDMIDESKDQTLIYKDQCFDEYLQHTESEVKDSQQTEVYDNNKIDIISTKKVVKGVMNQQFFILIDYIRYCRKAEVNNKEIEKKVDTESKDGKKEVGTGVTLQDCKRESYEIAQNSQKLVSSQKSGVGKKEQQLKDKKGGFVPDCAFIVIED